MESVSLSYINNPHRNRDVEYSFYKNKILHYMTATWRVRNESLCRRLLILSAQVFYNFFIVFFNLGFLFGILTYIHSTELRVKLFLNSSFFYAFHMKYIILTVQGTNIRFCYEQLQSLWENIFIGSRQHMLYYAKRARKTATISITLVYIVVMTWQAVAIAQKVTVVNNVTIHNLPYPSHYFFFNSYVDPYYIYVHSYHISTQLFFGALISITSTPATFGIQISGQYDLLIHFVHTLSANESPENFKSKIKMIIRRHHDLMR